MLIFLLCLACCLPGVGIAAERAAGPAPDSAAAGNLLVNGGFEAVENIGLDTAAIPGWKVNGTRQQGLLIKQDSAEDLFGAQSLKLQMHALPAGGDWEICQDLPAAVLPSNRDYIFTGWINSYKGSGAFKIRLIKQGVVSDEFVLAAWDGQGEYRLGSGRWMEYSKVFNPGNSDMVQIVCSLKKDEKFIGDTVWFDGLALSPAENPLEPRAAPATGAFPAEIYLQADAPAGGDGSLLQPFSQLQAALDAAGPGTVVQVGPGVYTGSAVFRRGGGGDAPLTLRGVAGAVLQGALPAKLNWQPAPDWGAGVYATTSPIGFIRGIYFSAAPAETGWKLPLIRYERAGDAARAPDDIWHFRNIFRDGIMTPEKQPGQGFELLRAVAMFNPEDRRIYIRFGDNRDPNILFFRLVQGEALIDADGVSNIVVEGLSLINAVKGVNIKRSQNVTVRNCNFTAVEYGIKVKFSRAVKSLHNILTLHACHEMNPHKQSVNTPPGPRFQMDVWGAYKWVGYYDRCAIGLSESADCEVSGNYIHDYWDGISVGGRQAPGNIISRNCIVNIRDDALTVTGDAGQEWRGNTIMNAFAGLRYWPNPHNRGPVYIYGNRFLQNRQDNVRFMHSTDAEIYIYHNTAVGGDGVRYHAVEAAGTPNVHVYNNLFIGNYFGMTSRVRAAKIIPNFKAGYNVYLDDPHGVIAKYGLNEHGSCGADYIEKGVDLSTYFGRPLPGCPPGYFEGKAPDCGASALKVN